MTATAGVSMAPVGAAPVGAAPVGGQPTGSTRAGNWRGNAGVLRVLLALVAGLLIACWAGAAPALAHAELEATTPANGAELEAAPGSVELQFSEPVQLIEGTIRLFPGGDAEPVELDAAVANSAVTIDLPPDLGDGAYAVSYRVVSADGHPVGGALTFQVGQGQFEAPQVTTPVSNPAFTEGLVSVLTGVQYLGLLGFVGLLFFEHVVLRGVRSAGERPDPLTRKLLRNTYGAAAISALLLLPASGSRVTGNEFMTFNAETGDFIILPPSGWWPGASGQVIASAVLITVAGWIALIIGNRARHTAVQGGAAGRTGQSPRPGTAALASLVLAFVALIAPVLVGHTQTIQPTWMMIAADIGHLAAGAFWVGGVIGLLRFLGAASPAAKGDEPRIAPLKAAQVVIDFSRFALASVIVLAVSGVLMAVLILGAWEAVFATAYGRTLLIKLGVVVAVVALAAFNRTRLMPHLMSRPDAPRQWATLKRIVIAEVALLICVLGVTGFLTNATPKAELVAAQSQSGQPQSTQPNSAQPEQGAPIRSESQGLAVEGTLAPAATGENVFTFELTYEGETVTPESIALELVTVDARSTEQGLGPLDATVTYDADTQRYEAAVDLPIAGNWQLQVAVRVDTYTQPIVVLPVVVGAQADSAQPVS